MTGWIAEELAAAAAQWDATPEHLKPVVDAPYWPKPKVPNHTGSRR